MKNRSKRYVRRFILNHMVNGLWVKHSFFLSLLDNRWDKFIIS